MSDPTIVTLERDYPSPGRDPHWVSENLENAARLLGDQAAGVGTPLHFASAVADLPEVRQWVTDLVARAAGSRSVVPSLERGPSLLLTGKVGRGKTFQAWGAVRALAVSGLRVSWRFTTAADLYAALRPRAGVDSESVLERHARARLLVLDDIGAAKGTEFTEEVNYRLINYRYERDLPTLFTSNWTPKELVDVLGDRVASRLFEMTRRAALKGDDRRRTQQAPPSDPPAAPLEREPDPPGVPMPDHVREQLHGLLGRHRVEPAYTTDQTTED